MRRVADNWFRLRNKVKAALAKVRRPVIGCCVVLGFAVLATVQPHKLGGATGLYVFSSIVQGYAGLLAILGAFLIFQLQVIESERGTIRRELYQLLHRHGLLPGDLEVVLERVRSAAPNQNIEIQKGQTTPRLGWNELDGFREYDRLGKRVKWIIARSKQPFVLVGLTIGVGAVLLPASEIMNKYYDRIEAFLVGGATGLAIWCLITILAFVKDVIGLKSIVPKRIE